jgi:hypothetical protein
MAILAAIGAALTAISTTMAATAFSIGTFAVTWGMITNVVLFGGVALAATLSAKTPDFGSMSPTYQGQIQTQTNQDLPVPLLYGTCKLAGNRIWQDPDGYSTIRRIIAFAEGEICDFSDIRLNDIPIHEISGISVAKYYGTQQQITDGIVGGSSQEERAERVGSLKNIAYLAISVPRSMQIDINYNLTAIVKGRKVRVYRNRFSYTIEYSENPAWALFDFLTCYNGLGLCLNNYGSVSDGLVEQIFDLNSFIESAAYCDQLVGGKPRFTFNMIFDAQTSARTLIDEIYRSCRGGLFIKDGKLQFKIDKAESVSKVFTEDDIIKNSETFQSIPKEEHYDILKCTYISPEHEWQKVEATAEIPEYRDGVPIEHSVNIFSCTNFEQASRLAWYYVNAKVIQPYFGSFQTDYKACDLEVGDVIKFNSLLMGLQDYNVKVTSITDSGAGIFTVNWRSYDERLYSDKLGSKMPRVVINSLTDVYAYPENVINFNVVQYYNYFNFVWQMNQDITNTYEIRMGESWEEGIIIKSKITENKFFSEIPTNGFYKFWIKAFNGYNYSKTPTLTLVNVDSVPSVNEIVKFDVLKELSGTFDENIKAYQNTLKLKTDNILWETLQRNWENNSDSYYQNAGIWEAKVFSCGVYESQVYDIGRILDNIVHFDYQYTSTDRQNDVLIEWAYSEDGETFTDWSIINTGAFIFRYCKFRITLKAYNNVQTILTKFVASIDVPDKDLELELEITDPEGLLVEYDFTAPPSIVATVNDNINAYIVITEKTSTYAEIKAYANTGEPVTCKLSLYAKGY